LDFGLTMFPTDETISLIDFGRAVEDYGFESIFLGDHTHIPASRLSPYPAGGELPREFWHWHDPLIAFTAIAAVTTKLILGTGALVLTERDPIVLAKQVASLDHISKGRIRLGVGAGWNLEAMANAGTHPRHRMAVFTERLLAIKALWTMESAEYHGKYVNFDPIWMWPKPVQKPHPPVLMGGSGPRILERVLTYGDEWLASGRHLDGDLLRAKVEELSRLAAERGRAPVPVSIQQGRPEPRAIEDYISMGLVRCILRVDPVDPAGVIDQIKKLAKFLRPWRT
jgi:probable F420-dependent oxidoreductase